MLRIFLGIFFLTACTHHVKESGGERIYTYDVLSDYSLPDLHQLAPRMITTLERDPPVAKLRTLFAPGMGPIKRIGVLVFESVLQSTPNGLTGQDKIYLSAQGKQLLTEKLLTIWEQSLPLLGSEFEYQPISKIRKAAAYQQHGSTVEDFVRAPRTAFAPDDIFFAPAGKAATTATVINPRGTRDFSLLTVAASELMMGPKFSEHHKHLVNEVAREWELDAVLVVMNEVSWSASRFNVSTKEIIPEELMLKLSSTVVIPFGEYHRRLERLGLKERPKINVSFRTYQAQLRVPVLISLPEEDQNFEAIEAELLNPLLKTYKDFSQMMIIRILDNLRTTK